MTDTVRVGDTIAAISSAVGPSARIIVRVSGPDALRIASGLAVRSQLSAGSASLCEIEFSDLRVPAWAYAFQSPRSYSGEDLVEFHIPGNPLLARMLLHEVISRGARHAEAGEFTARAFLSGRISLPAAEAVAATVAAHSERELRAARQLASGELSRRLAPIMQSLTDSLALLEVGIDFSEEDVTFISQSELRTRIASADQSLETVLAESERFAALSHEPQIVLVGRPNAGKSTLLNALAQQDRAVVSAEAGTTRDALSCQVRLRRGRVRIIDIAGLDDDACDHLAGKMQRQARRTIETADMVVLVQDITDSRPPPDLRVPIDLTVMTKIDLISADRGDGVSALTGKNMDLLRERLDALAFGQPGSGATLALNARHLESVAEARHALARARQAIDAAGVEVVALELREALDCLGRILGSVTPDDVLGRIFSSFCIGK